MQELQRDVVAVFCAVVDAQHKHVHVECNVDVF